MYVQTPFSELQPDALNGQVLKYTKTVYQLEKGLPPNGVVPKLKGKVEDMKDKVITHTIMCMYTDSHEMQNTNFEIEMCMACVETTNTQDTCITGCC